MKVLLIYLGLIYLTGNWPNIYIYKESEYQINIGKVFGFVFGMITLYYIAEYIEQVI